MSLAPLPLFMAKPKTIFQYSVFCIIIRLFLNDYTSDYIKAQTECQPLFAKIFLKIKISGKSVYHTHI